MRPISIPAIAIAAGLAAASCTTAQPRDGGNAAEAAAAAARAAWSPEFVGALACDDGGAWDGGEAVADPKHDGHGAIRWHNHGDNGGLACSITPGDLSAFNRLSFRLHSATANNATFMIIAESQREENVFSYYSKKVTVDWTGWKKIDLHFRSFGRARTPVGWKKIDRLRFSASGWNQSPQADSDWVFDQIEFSYDPKPYRPVPDVKPYVAAPPRDAFLAKLRREHPRLILTDDELPRLKRYIRDDPRGATWYENVQRKAEDLYRRPVREHELPDGRRLLSISRDVVHRMYHWGLLHRLEGGTKWRDRAWQEMEAVVNFPDWNPSHYLDTAEMMHALGIGYDWFYHDLTPKQRRTIRNGLWQHGLRLSHAAYMGLDAEGRQGWIGVTNNWNFVCNGGTSLAAMAVLDEMPEPCTDILHQAFSYIQIPIRHFEPDGAWWEGLGYWGYSMRYFVPYLRGLETAFGTDFGFVENLSDAGFALAGDFPVYMVSPLGGIYNFADSGSGGGTYQHFALFYLAKKFNRPLYQRFQEDRTRGGIQDLLYYRPATGTGDKAPLDKHFRKTEVATMRSSWTDPNALYVGIKCGRNGIAHAHQDLGSFIFHGLGEPWLIDPGTERQTYLRHQHGLPKHHFYRIREEGHNTLVLNPGERYCQDPKGSCEVERFATATGNALAVTELTQAYRAHAASAVRGFRLLNQRRSMLVQDEVVTKAPAELWWFAHAASHTEMALEANGREATFKRNGKTCRAALLSPPEARFQIMDATPLPSSPNPDIQNPNAGMQKLAIHLTDVETVTICVLLTPHFDHEPLPTCDIAVEPIGDWKPETDARPVLASLTVNGTPLVQFDPDIADYTVELPPDSTTVPAIAARAPTGCTVESRLPKTVPGTAAFTVTDRATNARRLYRVRIVNELLPGGTDKPHFQAKPVTIEGMTVTASRHDGNPPANALDSNLETRWSANGTDEWLGLEFPAPRTLAALQIAWFNGDQRRATFEIRASDDGTTWRTLYKGESSGRSATLECYEFQAPVTARFVRIVGHGNSSNLWNSITELQF